MVAVHISAYTRFICGARWVYEYRAGDTGRQTWTGMVHRRDLSTFDDPSPHSWTRAVSVSSCLKFHDIFGIYLLGNLVLCLLDLFRLWRVCVTSIRIQIRTYKWWNNDWFSCEKFGNIRKLGIRYWKIEIKKILILCATGKWSKIKRWDCKIRKLEYLENLCG